MRFSTLPAVLVLFSVSACAGDGPAAPPDSAAMAFVGTDGSPGLPISGECEFAFAPPPFPLPPVFVQADVGTCRITHLGTATARGQQEISLVAGTQTGERTFTAADGDELRALHIGLNTPIGPGLVSFAATMTFAGGTGRFSSATGGARALGTANLIARTSLMTFEGTIDFVASDRSNR